MVRDVLSVKKRTIESVAAIMLGNIPTLAIALISGLGLGCWSVVLESLPISGKLPLNYWAGVTVEICRVMLVYLVEKRGCPNYDVVNR